MASMTSSVTGTAATLADHLEERRRRIIWSVARPEVIFVLSGIGLVTAGLLARQFKYALLSTVVIAAVITPTQDFANLLIMAGPMVALYGVGIVVAWILGRRRRAPDEPV